MKQEIKEYSDAVEAHLEALKNEIVAKDLSRKTYYTLMRCKEAMRDKEREIIEDSERIK